MSDMTQQEADRLLSYGSHLDECSVNNGLRGLVCDCGFGELRDEALVLFAPTATPQPAFHLKVVVAGACITGDCDCMKYDQKTLTPNEPPPFHDGCTCYLQPATDDAPEAGTETGASQTVDGNLHPINDVSDVSNTWDWGPEDWVEHYGNQIVSLRAELATVEDELAATRHNRDMAQSDLAAERVAHEAYLSKAAELQEALDAEREAHAATQSDLDASKQYAEAGFSVICDWLRIDPDSKLPEIQEAIKSGREHADRLATALFDHLFTQSSITKITGVNMLRRHNARREKGADGE